MSVHSYPKLEIRLDYLRENTEKIVKLASEFGIEITGVIKGATGIPECSLMMEEGGAASIASSRIEQLIDAKNAGVKIPLIMLRIPMISEAEDIVRYCDISVNSEIEVLKALNKEAISQGKIHKVLLMAELGDLREGFWERYEIQEAALMVEEGFDGLYLQGVGVNLGCYGSLDYTVDKLEELIQIAEDIESAIGRKLDWISGGSSRTIERLLEKDIPKRINHFRVGEAPLLARDLETYHGYDMSFLHKDVFTLKAEVIEVKNKPSYPFGTISVDAFGNKPHYEDRGVRKRALLGVGKADYGSSIENIFPHVEGVKIIGASSDHTILDIEDVAEDIKVGDVLSFNINYGSMIFLTSSRNVVVELIKK